MRNLYRVRCSVMSEYIIGGANSWQMHYAEFMAKSPKLASETAKAKVVKEMESQARSPAAEHFMGTPYDECFDFEVERINR